jgi:hypothetical protein
MPTAGVREPVIECERQASAAIADSRQNRNVPMLQDFAVVAKRGVKNRKRGWRTEGTSGANRD